MTDQSSRNFLAFLCFAAVGLIACNGHGDRQEAKKAAILNHQPFAAHTDSLNRRLGNDRAGIFFRRAELLSHYDQHELAADDYSEAWILRPDETTGLRYASTLTIIGQTGKAIGVLQEGRKKFPENPEFSAKLAELLAQSNRIRDAIGVYDIMVQSDSMNFDAWYEKGLLAEQQGDTAAAIGALKRAYAIRPLNTYGLELAHLYAEKNDPAALPICDSILRKDTVRDLIDPLFIKGIYFSNTAQYKKAVVQFDSCIGRDWKYTDAYLEKGIALFKQQKYQLAMESFQMTVKVSETDADGYFWIGRCYEATGLKQQALAYYRQALALDKTFTEAADRIRRLQ